jgi:hypothetical protein
VPPSIASFGDDDDEEEEEDVVMSAKSSLEEKRRIGGVVGVGLDVDNSCKGNDTGRAEWDSEGRGKRGFEFTLIVGVLGLIGAGRDVEFEEWLS